jgi:hypothetical protein
MLSEHMVLKRLFMVDYGQKKVNSDNDARP